MSIPEAKCRSCGAAVSSPRTTLAIRVQRRKPATATEPVTLEIEAASELFCYCGIDCWYANQAAISAELGLSTSYPAGGAITPCSKCGKPVDRSASHVSYAVLEEDMLELGNGDLVARVKDDVEFACLCSACDSHSAEVAEQGDHLAVRL